MRWLIYTPALPDTVKGEQFALYVLVLSGRAGLRRVRYGISIPALPGTGGWAVCSVFISTLWKGATCAWGLRRVRCGISTPSLPGTGRWIFFSTWWVFALSRTPLPVLRREESARYPCNPLSLITGRWAFFPYTRTYLYSLEGCFLCVKVDKNEMIDIHSSSRYCGRWAVCSVCINSLWKGVTCAWGLRRVRCGISTPALPGTGRWAACSVCISTL